MKSEEREIKVHKDNVWKKLTENNQEQIDGDRKKKIRNNNLINFINIRLVVIEWWAHSY